MSKLVRKRWEADFGAFGGRKAKQGFSYDAYVPDPIADQEFHLLDFWPEPGRYTLRLECVGRNPRSTGHFCGIESVRLRERRPRVTDYGFDQDKDWRQSQILHR